MNNTMKTGVAFSALSVTVYAVGAVLSGKALLVMIPLAIGSFLIFGDIAYDASKYAIDEGKKKLQERKEKKDLDSIQKTA